MDNITDPLETGARLAALGLPVLWYFAAMHLAKVQQRNRTPSELRSERTLIFLASCGALIWGFVDLQHSLTGWPMLAVAVTWKVYVFLSLPILCWIGASVVVKAFSSALRKAAPDRLSRDMHSR